MADYEYDFDPEARDNTAASVCRMARDGGDRILDLGSGPGIVAGYLATEDGKVVTCVDQSADALRAAAARGVARTFEADLAGPDWCEELAGESFDVIVLADVLEHLLDPAAVLERINDADLLAAGGHLVVSIPNAGHEAVLAELIKGRFTYQDTGLLDSTHVRFFTLASLRELLEHAGFFVTHVERTRRTAEQTSLAERDVALPDELRNRLLEASAEAQTYQYIVRAEPAEAARELARTRLELDRALARAAEDERLLRQEAESELVAERDTALGRVADLELELAQAGRDLARLEQQLSEVQHALVRERRVTATERKRLEQVLADGKKAADSGDLDRAHREIARLEKKLTDVYQSRTWKVGRAAWAAFHAPGRLVRRKTEPEPTAASTAAIPTPPTESAPTVEYRLVEDRVTREKYQTAIDKRSFSGTGRKVAIAVFTDDLDAGRGDLYTAVGLGRRLDEIGFDVIYLPQEQWYEPPPDTEIYVAMLETVDVTRLPAEMTTVAWVRNQTEAWARTPWLGLFDLVLASSQGSLDLIGRSYPGPTAVLPIGVDTDLFKAEAALEHRQGVATTVNQWGREREVFSFLKERKPDFPLALYGQQRGIADELAEYARGPVSFFSLPSLYNQARVVLDDFNHTTAGYGNVNSRLFEAAACGAIVLTNRSTGLSELGLEETPVFTTARELFDGIGEALGSDEFAKTAEELRDVVLAGHSYSVRAVAFAECLERIGTSGGEGVVLSHYPNWSENPYTEMMWADLRSRQGIPMPVDDSLNFTSTIRAAEHRPTVFHLNWTAPILADAVDDHDRLVRHRRLLEAIDEMHSHGIPTIWTIHNVLPHESADRDLEAGLRQELADRVDIVHVMCEETRDACAEWFEIPESKIRVVPHPSYVDVYPNLIDRVIARGELGLRPEDFVYLHFGQVRPYKGVDLLLDAFDQLSAGDSSAKLLMAGRGGRFEGIRQLVDRARAHPSVLANFNSVPDADVQLYMNAADVVVLPHRAALNSGALLLAYSFARPVVSPAVGCLGGLVDDLTGVTFDPDDGVRGLQNAMLAARDLTPDHGRAAYRKAEALHYLDVSKQFTAVINEALGM